MKFRILLLPFSLIYGFVVLLRNTFYDIGIFKENKFIIPVISVGNLTTGGTGKTPHIEYLAALFAGKNSLAILSRGYGRRTKGIKYVATNSFAEDVGDEPLQLKNKFTEITVAVCEKRKDGIEKIIRDNPKTSVILLDDAFQHRAVKPGLSILLLEYSKIFQPDFLLPAGNLREPFSSRKRADVIIITKCSAGPEEELIKQISAKIKPSENQHLFFSSLSYSNPKSLWGKEEFPLDKNVNIMLVTGIANPVEIKKYVSEKADLIKHLNFSDHHTFTDHEIENIVEIFSTIAGGKKIILTTEKDAMRLKTEEGLRNLPVYYLPVEIKFQEKEEEKFNKLILEHVGKN